MTPVTTTNPADPHKATGTTTYTHCDNCGLVYAGNRCPSEYCALRTARWCQAWGLYLVEGTADYGRCVDAWLRGSYAHADCAHRVVRLRWCPLCARVLRGSERDFDLWADAGGWLHLQAFARRSGDTAAHPMTI